MKPHCLAAIAMLVALGACTSASDGPTASVQNKSVYMHAVLMLGETTIDKDRFEAVFKDGSRKKVPPGLVRVETVTGRNAGKLYLFKNEQRLKKICIGKHCGIFTRGPGRRLHYAAVFPKNFGG